MVEELPPQVSTFKVVGRLVKGVADSNDVGLLPEMMPVAGAKIVFTPNLNPPVFKIASATPPVTMYQESIQARTDDDGYLVGPNDDTQGVMLVFGGDPSISPSGWTWVVTVTPGGNFPPSTFSILGSVDGVYDLSTLIPVPKSPGTEVAQWAAAVSTTQQNVAATTALRDETLDIKNDTQTLHDQVIDAKDQVENLTNEILVIEDPLRPGFAKVAQDFGDFVIIEDPENSGFASVTVY